MALGFVFKPKILTIIILIWISNWVILSWRKKGGVPAQPNNDYVSINNQSNRTLKDVSALKTTLENRVSVINEMCFHQSVQQRLNNYMRVPRPELYSYDNIGLCTCKVPKSGSTFITRILLVAQNPNASIFLAIPGQSIQSVRHQEQYRVDTCPSHPDNRGSFIITRNPYSRLFSSYVDKIYLAKFLNYGKTVYMKYQTNPNEPGPQISNGVIPFCRIYDVPFALFLKDLATKIVVDKHFAPISKLCNVCQIKYQLILKQENLEEESAYLFQLMDIHGKSKHTIKSLLTEDGTEREVLDVFHSVITSLNYHVFTGLCQTDAKTFDQLLPRVWETLKIRGYINRKLQYDADVFMDSKINVRTADDMLYTFKSKSIPLLNAHERERQRYFYLTEAYKGVNNAILQSVQNMFKLDFMLFGYNRSVPNPFSKGLNTYKI